MNYLKFAQSTFSAINGAYDAYKLQDKNSVESLEFKEYYLTIKEVLNLLQENKSNDEIKSILLKNSGIQSLMHYMTMNDKSTSGINITHTYDCFLQTILSGYKCDSSEEFLSGDEIYDLSSISEVFLRIAIYNLYDMGLVDFDESISKYLPKFKYLDNVTVRDLIENKISLTTSISYSNVLNFDALDAIITKAFPVNKEIRENDDKISLMILKQIVESVSGMLYADYVSTTIFKPLEMDSTSFYSPDKKIPLVVPNFNYSETDRLSFLAMQAGETLGYDSVFSTPNDMIKFAKRLHIVLADDLIKNLKVADPLEAERQYPYLSKDTLSFSNAYGTELRIDFKNEMAFFIGLNQTRPTNLIRTSSGIVLYEAPLANNKKQDKDELLKLIARLSIQYRFLDEVTKEYNKTILVRKL